MLNKSCNVLLYSILLIILYSNFNYSLEIKSTVIKFTPTVGAIYYELQFIASNNNSNKTMILKTNKSPFKVSIEPIYSKVQIRAVFKDDIKTKWGKFSLITYPEIKNTTIVHSELIELEDKPIINTISNNSIIAKDHSSLELREFIYKSALAIQPPFSYELGHLTLGPETTIDFTLYVNKYDVQKSIYYRFRLKENEGGDFIEFKKPFKIKTLFVDIQQPYLLEFYAVFNNKYREKIKSKLVIIDTESPDLFFTENEDTYEWKITHWSQSIDIKIFLNDQALEKPDIIDFTFKIPKKLSLNQSVTGNLTNPVQKKVTIILKDRSNNQNTWNKLLTFY